MTESEVPPPSRIFLSYRREDAGGHVLALVQPLRERFGPDRVFIDTDSIAPGQDFVSVIQDQLQSCTILLAMIGKDWMRILDETGARRIDNPGDYVRLEIATALKNEHVMVIPVLVERASMPAPKDLPPDLEPLARRNALELSDTRWESDVERLITAISTVCGEPVPSSRQKSHAAVGRPVFRYHPALRARGAAAMLGTGLTVAVLIATILDIGPLRQWADRLFSDNVVAFAERDWLLVANFENQTGDSVFERSLDTALAVGLTQSSYVNVVPASRVEGALRRMKKTPLSNGIDAATAREIAQREGIKLVLAPSIAAIGGVYQLSGSLHDPATGVAIKSAVVRVQQGDDVLAAMDDLILKIRRELGEATQSISQQGKPLAEVTTQSLEALKVYSAASGAYKAGRIDEARALLEESLQLDPSFTAARAQLGMLNFELRDREKGKELLAQSVKEVERLTDRERLSVLAFHAAAVENNPEKAAEYYKALVTLYPDAANGHNNLGRAYMQMGRWDEAVAPLKRAIALDPDTMLTYHSLNEVYVDHLGDLDAAIALCRQQLTYNDQIEYPYSFLGWALLGKGDPVQAREAFQKALTLNPRNADYLFRIGYTYRLERRYHDARDNFLKALSLNPAYFFAYYESGVASQMMGDRHTARAHFLAYRKKVEEHIKKNPRAAGPYLSLSLVLFRLGEYSAAEAAARRGRALDPNRHFDHAVLLALQGRRADAITELQRAVEKGYRNFVSMKINVDLEPLAAEPAFQTILARGLRQ